MRKLLLGTTALAAAATLSANSAFADVSITGYMEWVYNSRSSNVTALDGTTFNSDSDMQVTFSNKTDSGLDVSMQVDMDTDAGALGNDETSLTISGGFGKVILGHNDAAAEVYNIDESDLVAEDSAPAVSSTTIGTSSSLSLGTADSNKVTYHLPAMGGLTAGVSHYDSGAVGGTDATSMGAKYSMDAGGAAITLGYATNTVENSTQDKDSSSMGVKIVSGDISMIISQGDYEADDEDISNMGASVSYKMSDTMTVAAYTFDSEDDLDAGEEYSRSGVELLYTIASGLTAAINIDDYDYKAGTSQTSVSDSGTNSSFKLKASF